MPELHNTFNHLPNASYLVLLQGEWLGVATLSGFLLLAVIFVV